MTFKERRVYKSPTEVIDLKSMIGIQTVKDVQGYSCCFVNMG